MTTRRRDYLTIVGSAATVSFAGCLGGESSEAIQTSYDCDLTSQEPVSSLPQPTLGPDDATVTVDFFEDFACPHCATFATGSLQQLKNEYLNGESVRFRHFDFPIPVSETWSYAVANAARSVQESLTDAAFFEFSQAAYQNQAEYAYELLGDLADSVGAAPCRVMNDISSETYDQVVADNKETGISRGVESTPQIFVNGEKVTVPRGGDRYTQISNAIDANL
ncbi:MAG: protein-disulfide isomerase [Halonotius sp. J07HN6]|jgi:Protein-disulfide isomerase|nr:MAG: protein-disulfide isomerase [Halonotius sp. J07HN6]ERH05628.1 MAG: protein-disulfide isomerase [Halonotius sp. J07HN4]